MNIKGLRAFASVMATGSLLSAARELNTSVSALSRQLSMLEAELDFLLFSRENRHLTPLARAYAFLPEVERLLAGFDQLPAVVADIKRLPARRLRIGAMPRMANCIVEPAIAEYLRTNQAADIAVNMGPRAQLERGLLENRLDIAFGSLPVNHDAMTVVPLCRLPAVVIVHPDHRLADRVEIGLADIDGEDFVTMPSSTLLGKVTGELFAEAGIRVKSRLQVSQTMSCCNLVAEGCGIAVTDAMAPAWLRSKVVLLKLRPTVFFEYGVFHLDGAKCPDEAVDIIALVAARAAAFSALEAAG